MDDEPHGGPYVVDTSSWIALFRGRPRERHGGAWAGMSRLVDRGLVTSPLAVRDELSARQDDLLSWVDGRPQIFVRPSREMPDRVIRINGRLPLLNKSKSRPSADPHVIALAVVLRAHGLFGRAPDIVTEEADRPDRPTRIPSVARLYGISCINMDGLIGREGLGRRSPRGPGPAHA